MNQQELIRKYNVPGPRYTSYPTVPYWKPENFQSSQWQSSVQQAFAESKEDGISVYIHLPFCESMCTFCGCHKHITKQHSVELPYLKAVLAEWEMYVELLGEAPLIKELHLGGGTPTFFSIENLKFLVNGLFLNAKLHPEAELGLEGHPNNTTIEHLEGLYGLGFRRISYGVQDYNPEVQRIINRVQPFENVEFVHEKARAVGFESISHDLVFGLPNQSLKDILHTIELTRQLRPDRISLYSYAHVPWVKGVGQRLFDESDLPSPEEKREMYEAAKQALQESGYEEVGMDHFALPSDTLYQAFSKGTLHRNFMGYTTSETQLMIGLGMSAISDSWYGFAQNEKTTKGYLERVKNRELPVFRGHHLSQEDLIFRRHILDLMCHFYTEWGSHPDHVIQYSEVRARLEPLVEDGLAKVDEEGVSVTAQGKVFVRNICMCFDLHLHAKSVEKPQFSKTI